MSHSELSAQAPRRTRDRILDAARIVAIALFPYPFLVLFAWGVPYGWVYVFAYGGWVLFGFALIWVRRGHALFPKLPTRTCSISRSSPSSRGSRCHARSRR